MRERFSRFIGDWTVQALAKEWGDGAGGLGPALADLYRLAGLAEPTVVWLPCPLSAGLSAMLHVAAFPLGEDDSAVTLAVNSVFVPRPPTMLLPKLVSHNGFDAHTGVLQAVRAALATAAAAPATSTVSEIVMAKARAAIDPVIAAQVEPWMADAVRSGANAVIHASAGAELYGAVDFAVRWALRTALSIAMTADAGSPIVDAMDSYFGGSSHDVAYAAYVDFLRATLDLPISGALVQVFKSLGFFWLLDGVCFASEPPDFIRLDDKGRLHADIGQAIGYRSGWGLHYKHGVAVEPA